MRLLTSLVAATLFAIETLSEETPAFVITDNQRAANQSLLWGTYRPQVFLGVKPRIPKSLFTGLMWMRLDDYTNPMQQLRHTCEQRDDILGYDWEDFDVRKGGRQVVKDEGNGIDLTAQFIKVEGGTNGGHWGLRVKGEPRDGSPKDLTTAFWFYAALEGEGDIGLDSDEQDPKGLEGDVVLTGKTPELGKFHLTVTEGKGEHPEVEHESANTDLSRSLYQSFNVPARNLWMSKDILFSDIQKKIQSLVKEREEGNLPPSAWVFSSNPTYGKGNYHMVNKIFNGPFEFDILFSSDSAAEPLTSKVLDEEIPKLAPAFKERFSAAFPRQAPFDASEYDQFINALFSNVLGGIGYFSGDQVVDRSYDADYEEMHENFWDSASAALQKNKGTKEGPYELFSTTPSRPFFPRGFYWDEGFHQMLIADWDIDLTLEIIRSWINRMDKDGWISREQILGDEARSKVPQEFWTQYPHHANPPTMFLVIDNYLNMLEQYHSGKVASVADPSDQQIVGAPTPSDSLTSSHLHNPDLALNYLKTIYPSLRKHYHWFRSTQASDLAKYGREAPHAEAYRWRGRTPDHCLTSGFDDYPRPSPPHPGELHVDLISWMALMTRSIRRIAEKIGEKSDAEAYAKLEKDIVENINVLHWSEDDGSYCDLTIDDFEESEFDCHKGYVSLLPFVIGGVIPPDSEKLGAILETLADPEQLWSDYGIRSLSKSSPHFGTGENYWRGPIWLNLNFLIIKSLHNYGSIPGPYQKRSAELYKLLRENVVKNVFEQWKSTGYAWEQYDSETGKGQRTKHFAGWTSLVVKIMGMDSEVTCKACTEDVAL